MEEKKESELCEVEYRSRDLIPMPNGEQTMREMHIRTKGKDIAECLTVFDRFLTKISMPVPKEKKKRNGKKS